MATDAGGVPSVVEDGANGLLFRPDDADGLVGCLERALAGGPAVERMVAEGRRRARERFDWSVVVDLHEAVFRRHMAPSGSAGRQRPRLAAVGRWSTGSATARAPSGRGAPGGGLGG